MKFGTSSSLSSACKVLNLMVMARWSSSSDAFNRSAIQTVIVAVITSNLKLERAPGNFGVLADEMSGLSQDSVVNVSQVLVVNKVRLLERRGQLDEVGSALLSSGLRRVFDLP